MGGAGDFKHETVKPTDLFFRILSRHITLRQFHHRSRPGSNIRFEIKWSQSTFPATLLETIVLNPNFAPVRLSNFESG